MTASAIIETKGLTKRYGGLTAVDSFDATFVAGEVSGVIGPNGAGKSTLIGLLGGMLRPTEGRIVFDGADITELPAPDRARAGIARTYQLPRPFLDMTVRENLQVAQFSKTPYVSAAAARREADTILEATGLTEVAGSLGGDLPLLRRKRLEVARALMLQPKLLLLDEVGAGLVDDEIDELIALFKSLQDGSMSIILIEHVIKIVRECCHNLVVLNFGRKLIEGTTHGVLADDEVASVYLGTTHQEDSRAKAKPPPAARPAFQREDTDGQPVEPGAANLLSLDKVTAGYGLARVLNGVSLDVARGEVVAILGTNGAGKTTLANVIAGSLQSTGGTVRFGDENVTKLMGHKRFGLGIAHCMEGRRIFPELSVEENLRIAMRKEGAAEVARRLERSYDLFPVLKERRDSPGTALSGGQLQMLAIGRALISNPQLVVFDEISLGLAPIVMDDLYATLAKLRDEGLTMIIIEQDVERALELADNVYVLQRGQFVLSGSAERIRQDRHVRDLYMGAPADA